MPGARLEGSPDGKVGRKAKGRCTAGRWGEDVVQLGHKVARVIFRGMMVMGRGQKGRGGVVKAKVSYLCEAG